MQISAARAQIQSLLGNRYAAWSRARPLLPALRESRRFERGEQAQRHEVIQ